MAAGIGTIALWLILLPFTIWGAHFLAVYVVTAIHCAKSTDAVTAVLTVRWTTVALTLLALAGLALVLRAGYARSGEGTRGSTVTRDEARFVRTLLVMMAALSTLAVLYVAAVVFFFEDCR